MINIKIWKWGAGFNQGGIHGRFLTLIRFLQLCVHSIIFLCFLGYFKYFIVFFSKLIKTPTIYLLSLWSYCRTQNFWFIRWTKFSCTSYTAVSLGVVSKKVYWSINMSFCVDLNPSRSRCLQKTCERLEGTVFEVQERTRSEAGWAFHLYCRLDLWGRRAGRPEGPSLTWSLRLQRLDQVVGVF